MGTKGRMWWLAGVRKSRGKGVTRSERQGGRDTKEEEV